VTGDSVMIDEVLKRWLAMPDKCFSRDSRVDDTAIHCDCSGLINLLVEELGGKLPYGIARPKAVHYFSVLQEVGSRHVDALKAGHLLSWRKEHLPKSGDTGHVLIVAAKPEKLDDAHYKVSVFDSTKARNGLSQRDIVLQVDKQGLLIGVRLHDDETKIKRTAMYHQALVGSRYCFGCGLPARVCCCDCVSALKEAPPIVILRHPDERKRTLSTVSLIKQRYPTVYVREGETFSAMRYPNLCVLFPEDATVDEREGERPNAEGLPSLGVGEGGGDERTLLLLDATWRKAKKMLHDNQWLSELPRVALAPSQISDYLIRKIPTPDSLSTVEAFALACKDHALQDLFRTFVEKQIALMGKEVYQRNYGHYLNFEEAKTKD